MTKQMKNTGEVLLYVAAGLLFGGIFFRQVIVSGFDLMLGDVGDAQFNNVILEHWWQVFQGQASWLSPSFFYPVQEVLGYSDTGFLNALPYAVLRSMGADRFASFQFVLFALIAFGWTGSILFFRRVLRVGIFPSIIGSVLFIFSNAMANTDAHTQMWSIGFIPYLTIALVLFFKHFYSKNLAGTWAGIFLAVMLPALFYTSFYIGWYFVFFLVLCAGVILAWCVRQREGRTFLKNTVCDRYVWLKLLRYGALCLVCFTPFLRTYIPAILKFGARSYQEASAMLPSWIDYFNVGPNNWLWGNSVYSAFTEIGSRPYAHELTKGLPGVLLLLFLLCCIGYFRKTRHYSLLRDKRGACVIAQHGRPVDPAGMLPLVAGGLCAAVLLAWLLMLKINGLSLWWLVFKLVPGAGSIRAVYRFQHVLAFPVAIVIVIFLNRVLTGTLPVRIRNVCAIILVLLGLLLIVEQFNTGEIAHCSKQQQREMLSRIPAPPPSADAFALWPVQDYSGWFFEAHIDAMMIAQHWGVRTINGYSGQVPAGWEQMLSLQEPTYSASLYQWIEQWNLDTSRICFLDLEKGQWFRMEDFTNRAPIQTMSGPLPPDGFSLKISPLEIPLRWCVGDVKPLVLNLMNQGTEMLCGVGANPRNSGQYAVCLAYRWVAPGKLPGGFNNRIVLPEKLMPGNAMEFKLNMAAPSAPGTYQLEIEALQEGVAWFKDKGSPGLSATVDIFEKDYYLQPSYDELFAKIIGNITVDFKENVRLQNVERVSGLSGAEPWGTWSDGKQVALEFSSPLPEKFRLYLVANAFGPNIGKNVTVSVGSGTASVALDAEPKELIIDFDNFSRSKRLIFDIPNPVSPRELNMWSDERKLGIGFVKLHIVPAN